MSGLAKDLRHALRALGRRPGATLAALVTLALGIGAVTGFGTIIYGLILRPMPGFDERRVVVVEALERGSRTESAGLSSREVEALRDAGLPVTSMVTRTLTLTGEGEPERVDGSSVAPDFFARLGVAFAAGGGFRDEDGRTLGQEEAVVVSHRLWQRRWGGDPGLLGRTIEINQRAARVVGILARGFALPETQALYLPMAHDAIADRDAAVHWTLLTRDPAQAEGPIAARVGAVFTALAAQGSTWQKERAARLVALRDALVDEHARRFLTLLFGAVVGVLLVACSNVSTLQLARVARRESEFAVRAALGAGRGRILRLQWFESLLLCAAGGAAGVLLGRWLGPLTLAMLDEDLPVWLSLDSDPRLVAATVGTILAAALVAGWLPARRSAAARFRSGSLGARAEVGDRAGRRVQSWLVASQFALALVLVALGLWMVQSFRSLARADVGFDPRPLLSARFYLPGDAWGAVERRAAMQRRLIERLAQVPGVEDAAITSALPADDGGSQDRVVPEGRPLEAVESVPVGTVSGSPDLFRVLGVPLLAGRALSWSEAVDPGSTAALVNRTLAARLWPDRSPAAVVGERLRWGLDADAPLLEVVGVVPDLVYEEIHEQTERSRHQLHVGYARLGWRGQALVVRARPGVEPGGLAAAVRGAVRGLEPDAPVTDVRAYPDRLRQTYADRRLMGSLFGAFALVTLVLAAVGVWAVVAYGAARRVREVGVRLALGASPRGVVRTIAGDGWRAIGWGAAIGLAAVVALSRGLAAFLWGVDTSNPLSWILAPLALGAVGAAASWLPARRAAAIEPAVALRSE